MTKFGQVDAPKWRKSSWSNDVACVEAAVVNGVLVRDSKQASGPRLRFSGTEWRHFILAAGAEGVR
ncbi:DUF397 domain-containing protein [Embleya sp. NBC_00896]|uniref:DUF397 domain-containing protein n=1 Tax=Embleya sp. NBC_00896 TaxID=2975961 RepID=UPI00386DBD23|nr:DUF397 domain-containing protein [Embleya sp. NBC_00896]